MFSELYTLLLKDSFIAALIFPSDKELVFDVMVYFGGYNNFYMVVFALVASILGLSVNFLAGRLIYLSRVKANLSSSEEKKIQKAVAISQKYGVWLLLFTYHGIFGSLISILAGLFNISVRNFLILTLAGRVAYYLLFLYTEGAF